MCSCSQSVQVVLRVMDPDGDTLLKESSWVEVGAFLGGSPGQNERPRFEVPQNTSAFTLGLAFDWTTELSLLPNGARLSVWAGALDASGCLIGYGRTELQIENGGVVETCPEGSQSGCSLRNITLSRIERTCERPVLVSAQPKFVDEKALGHSSAGDGFGTAVSLDGFGLTENVRVRVGNVVQQAVLAGPERLLIPNFHIPDDTVPGPLCIQLYEGEQQLMNDAVAGLRGDGKCSRQALVSVHTNETILALSLRSSMKEVFSIDPPQDTQHEVIDQVVLDNPNGDRKLVLVETRSRTSYDPTTELQLRVLNIDSCGRIQRSQLIEFPTSFKPSVANRVRLLAGNVDNSNSTDLVVVTTIGTVTYLHQTGDIYKASRQVEFGGIDGRLIDVNLDGMDDLILAGADLQLHLATGTESSPFQVACTAVPRISWPCALTTADYDRDGSTDVALIAYNEDTSNLSVHAILTEGGRLKVAKKIITIPGPLSLRIGSCPLSAGLVSSDFDRDGWPDLAINGNDTILLNHLSAGLLADRWFSETPFYVGFASNRLSGGSAMIAADMNADTLPDLVYTWGSQRFLVLRNAGRTTPSQFAEPEFIDTNSFWPVPNNHPRRLSAHDMDADGFEDLVMGPTIERIIPVHPRERKLCPAQ